MYMLVSGRKIKSTFVTPVTGREYMSDEGDILNILTLLNAYNLGTMFEDDIQSISCRVGDLKTLEVDSLEDTAMYLIDE